jgi:hypothetical protein
MDLTFIILILILLPFNWYWYGAYSLIFFVALYLVAYFVLPTITENTFLKLNGTYPLSELSAAQPTDISKFVDNLDDVASFLPLLDLKTLCKAIGVILVDNKIKNYKIYSLQSSQLKKNLFWSVYELPVEESDVIMTGKIIVNVTPKLKQNAWYIIKTFCAKMKKKHKNMPRSITEFHKLYCVCKTYLNRDINFIFF